MSEQKLARFFGKIKKIQGKSGDFLSALVDNPKPKNDDGSPNKYNKGMLLWFDNETGKTYQILSFNLTNAPEQAKLHGFTRSLMFDLGNKFHAVEIK